MKRLLKERRRARIHGCVRGRCVFENYCKRGGGGVFSLTLSVCQWFCDLLFALCFQALNFPLLGTYQALSVLNCGRYPIWVRWVRLWCFSQSRGPSRNGYQVTTWIHLQASSWSRAYTEHEHEEEEEEEEVEEIPPDLLTTGEKAVLTELRNKLIEEEKKFL